MVRREPSSLIELIRYGLCGRVNVEFCTSCDSTTLFVERGAWLREHYRCILCESLPRQRALMRALNGVSPDWRQLRIYEASAGGPTVQLLRRGCAAYTTSHLYRDIPLGFSKDGIRCENLEALTLPDASFDLVITQDVLEHVLNPTRAFAEI